MRTVIAATVLGLFLTSTAQAQGRPPQLDLNGDGKVTEAEFKTGQADQTMKLDRNKDGRVTKDETKTLEAMAKALGGAQATARIANLWRISDANSDGAITRAEAESAAGRRFPAFDTNKDGSLSEAEIAAMRKRSPGGGGRASN